LVARYSPALLIDNGLMVYLFNIAQLTNSCLRLSSISEPYQVSLPGPAPAKPLPTFQQGVPTYVKKRFTCLHSSDGTSGFTSRHSKLISSLERCRSRMLRPETSIDAST